MSRPTTTEIIENWEHEYQYKDWYAVQQYSEIREKTTTLFVGSEYDAISFAKDMISIPSCVDDGNFYRVSLIPTIQAYLYFRNLYVEIYSEEE